MSALRKFLFSFFIVTAIFLFSPRVVFADVMLNEFSSASDPEWIEIYNPESQTLPLREVILFFDNNLSTTQKVSFCDNEEISPNSFKLITRPNKSFWLANNGDSLILKRGDDVIDSISYGSGQVIKAPTATQSATRNPDGGLTWIILDSPTPQGDAISFECPAPTLTLTPTPTPEPTNIPTPTSSPTPKLLTSTPTPKLSTSIPTPKILTPTPSQKISPTPTPKKSNQTATDSGEVLGEEVLTISAFYPYEATDEAEKNEATPSARNKILPKIFLIGGLLLLFISACWLWYNFKYYTSR